MRRPRLIEIEFALLVVLSVWGLAQDAGVRLGLW